MEKKTSPRICYLADARSSHTFKWVSYFASQGYDVHLVSFRDNQIPGVTVHFIPPANAKLGKFNYIFQINQVRAKVRMINPELVHAHYATSYGLLGKLCGVRPYVLSVWGSDVLDEPKKAAYRWMVRSNLRSADFITATSHMLASATQKLLGDRVEISVIPFGVDTNMFVPRSNNHDQFVVGIVKTLEKKYGVEYLIRAFAKVCRSYPGIKLLIVGGGSLLEELKQLTQFLGISHCTTFTGAVPHSTIPDYLQEMDIFVVSSISESFGVAAIEASAAALPVIASRIGGLPEVVIDGQTGFLVKVRDIDAIAARIELLITNPELRYRMGEAGRQFVKEHYEWSNNAMMMKQLYEKILYGS